jgi:HK97 family phage major capsid protein
MEAVEIKRNELKRQIDAFLAKEKLTISERKQCDLAMSQLANLRTEDERRSKIALLGNELGLNFNVTAPTEEQRNKNAELEAFKRYMQYGTNLRTYVPMSDAVQGAYVVPAAFYNSLLTGIAQYTELLDEDNVNLIEVENGRKLTIPSIDLSTITSAQVLENVDAPPVTNPTVSSSVLNAFTYRTSPIAASFELETDSFEAISDILTQAFAVGLARGAGSDLVNGSGTGAPQGILTAAADSGITAASTTAYTAAELLALYGSVNRAYRVSPKCAWLMNDTTYQNVLSLKDTSGRPLVNITEDGERLYSKRIIISPDFPTAAGSKALAFGDVGQFVVKVLRNSVSVRRNVEAPGYAEQGAALYTAFMRFDSRLNVVGGTAPVKFAKLHA